MKNKAEITLKANYSDYDYSKICKPLFHSVMPVFRPLGWALFVLLLVAVVLTEYGRRGGDPVWRFWGGILLIVIGVAYMALVMYRGRLIWRAMRESPSRQGVTTVTMDEKGLDYVGTGYRTHLDWSVILDVIDGPDGGLLLRTAGAEAVPIPRAAIAEGMTVEGLKSHIEAWVAAAR